MKKKIIFLAAMLAIFSTAANAGAWCKAASHSAWGVGKAHSINEACQIALYQCSIRTSHHDTCYVVNSGY